MDQNPILLPFFSSKFTSCLYQCSSQKNHAVIGFQCYPHHSSVLTCAYSDANHLVGYGTTWFCTAKTTANSGHVRTFQGILPDDALVSWQHLGDFNRRLGGSLKDLHIVTVEISDLHLLWQLHIHIYIYIYNIHRII